MRTIVLLIAISMVLSANAQTIFAPDTNKLSVTATYVDQGPKIDGMLSEQVWSKAQVLKDFVQVEPNQGENSKFTTKVWVLYDEHNLYIGAYCEDPDGLDGMRVPELARDFNFRNNDTFGVGIDGFLDRRNSITFATNPYGAQKDYLSFDDTYFDSEWNGLWKVRTTRKQEGWYAEFQIPWKTIRYKKPSQGDRTWGINFIRLRRKSNEISAWSAYPRAFGFNRSEYFGLLHKVHPPRPTTNLQLNPYALTDFHEIKINNQSTRSISSTSMGGELKWAITPNTLIDATLNTDFAQAEADRQVNNISRFSILFPERRQFFLENASLFGTGLYSTAGTSGNLSFIPFFSRRIGLDNTGKPIDLDGGLRLVHRTEKHSFGIMGMREGKTDMTGPNYNFVGRYITNFGKQNRLGIISTLKTEDGNSNFVGGFDAFYRIDNSSSLETMTVISHDTADDKAGGLAGYARYRFTTNLIDAWWTESYLSENFHTKLGFASRTNVIATSPGIILNYRGKKLPFKNTLRAFKPRLMANWFHRASTGGLTESELSLSPFYLEAQNGAEVFYISSWYKQYITEPLSLLNESIASGEYNYARHQLGVSSDPSSKISSRVSYTFGSFYNGQLTSWDTALSWIPLPHIFLKGSFNSNKYKNFGSEDRSAHVDLYTFEGRFYLNPRISLSGLYQSNDQNASDFFNIRFSWEYNPLSYIYLVYNSNRNSRGIETLQETQAIFKISFLKQF